MITNQKTGYDAQIDIEMIESIVNIARNNTEEKCKEVEDKEVIVSDTCVFK